MQHHNEIWERKGAPCGEFYLACARLKSGDGRLGEVRCAADIPAGIAGNPGKFTASVLDASTLALLRRGAPEALGGHLDFSRNISALRKQGVDTLLT